MGAGRPTKRRRVAEPSPQPEPQSSSLLRLPLELRLQIYDYALSDVTIAVAEQGRNIFESALEFRPDIEGLPLRYVPSVKNDRCPEDMMIGPPKVLPYRNMLELSSTSLGSQSANTLAGMSMDSGYASAGSSMYSIASTSTSSLPLSALEETLSTATPVTNMSLLQINKQIRDEMLSHLQSRTSKQTTLYVTYPYGLLVLQHHYPALLKCTKHVVITGSYMSTTPEPTSPSVNSPTPASATTQSAATKALQRLTCTLYSSYRQVNPSTYYKTMPTLHMRIFYPDERRYSSVWGDNDSPIVAAVQHIPFGFIETKTWRGRLGNAVTMKAAPPKAEGETKWVRNCSSGFRRFKMQRGQSVRNRRDMRKSEDFWEEAFGDEEKFEKEVPEEKCWTKT